MNKKSSAKRLNNFSGYVVLDVQVFSDLAFIIAEKSSRGLVLQRRRGFQTP
jgi:hypothetical protein